MRNALRHLDLPFEELVIEARKVEEESKGATILAGVHAQPAAAATTARALYLWLLRSPQHYLLQV